MGDVARSKNRNMGEINPNGRKVMPVKDYSFEE
jgi:hypothetical protein